MNRSGLFSALTVLLGTTFNAPVWCSSTPLSCVPWCPPVLEILQLVKKRDLFLADSHVLELEQECNESSAAEQGAVTTPEDSVSPSVKGGGRRKVKDVELLYEELQKELWAVVRESLRCPTAGPNLGLVVQVRAAAALVRVMSSAQFLTFPCVFV